MHRTHQPCKTSLGTSLAQWTPSMAIGGGATIFIATRFMATRRRQPHLKPNKKYNKPNVKINIINEGYLYTMGVLQK